MTAPLDQPPPAPGPLADPQTVSYAPEAPPVVAAPSSGMLALSGVGIVLLAVSAFLDYGDGFVPVSLGSDPWTLLGSVVYYLSPPLLAAGALIAYVSGRRDRLFVGIALAAGILGITNPLGYLLFTMGGGQELGIGVLVGFIGGLLLIAGTTLGFVRQES